MSRILTIFYALLSYIVFFIVFLYLIAFVENYPVLADVGFHSTVNGPPSETPMIVAVLINLGLIALFAVQHTIMARQGFKQRWTKIVPKPVERATFVLVTSVILIILFWLWQPITSIVWAIDNNILATVTLVLSFAGWGIVLLSTFLLGHFSLFGVAQAWDYFQSKEADPPVLREPSLYKYMRHPLYFGFLLAFWAAPVMTTGHLIFALGFTIYILIGIRFEEKDMVHLFGEKYKDYQRRVSMLIPSWPKK